MGKDAEACGICGTAFDVIPQKCPLCDTEVDEHVAQCPNCGAELDTGSEPIPDTEIHEVEIAESPSEEDKETAELIASDVFVDVELEELVKLSGVGPLKAKILYDAGYTDLRTLKRASVVELMNVKGIGRKSAGEIKAALRDASLDEIRETPITKETVEAEYQCPLCETIVSAYETSCYECGCIFEPDGVADEDSDRLALSYYDSKLLRTPDNADLWYARGATLVKMEEYDQALNSFNRSLEIDQSFQAAWMSKAEVYNKLGDSTKAAECYSHIITKASPGMSFDRQMDENDLLGEPEADLPEIDEHISEPDGADQEPEPETPEQSSEPIEEETLPDETEMPEESAESEIVPEIEEAEEAEAIEEDDENLVAGEPAPDIEETEEELPDLEQMPESEPEPIEEDLPEAGMDAEDIEESDEVSLEEPAEPDIEEAAPETDMEEEDVDHIPPEPIETEIEEEPEDSATFEEEVPEEGPEVIKPHDFEEFPTGGLDINMDYTRPPPERPDLDSMDEGQMKKYLSKRATHVKPYLKLAKQLGVDINHAKRLIAKAVSESKAGNLKVAIEIINEGIEYAEDEFHRKLAESIENLVELIRDLMSKGIDASEAVDLVTESKESLEDGNIPQAVEKLDACLASIESLTQ